MARAAPLVLVLAAALASVDAAPRPEQRNDAVVAGQVVDAASLAPIPGASVDVLGSGFSTWVPPISVTGPSVPGVRVLTDSDGRFSLSGVPTTSLQISVNKAGWLEGAFGRVRAEGSILPIDSTDPAARRLVLRMWPAATIDGMLRDESGTPIRGVEVRALRRQSAGGRVTFTAVAIAASDAGGRYRLTGLAPGNYVVLTPPSNADATAGTPFELDALKGRMYPLRFFPNASSIGQASVIRLEPGVDRTGTDFRMRAVRAVNVEGTIRGVRDQKFVSPPRLIASEDDVPFAYSIGAQSWRTDGSFGFYGVPEGRYVIRSVRSGNQAAPLVLPPTLERLPNAVPPDRTRWTELPLVVGAAPISDVVLVLQDGPTVTGRIEFDPAAGSMRPNVTRFRVSLERMTSAGTTIGTYGLALSKSGALSTAAVPPGRYSITVGVSLDGWIVERAMLDGQDVTDLPFQLAGVEHRSVVVTFTNRAAQISGRVQSDAAATSVVVFPADRAAWRDPGRSLAGLRIVRAESGGRYIVDGLPSGDYFVGAIPDEQSNDWSDPATLDVISRDATRLQIALDDRKTLDLQVHALR